MTPATAFSGLPSSLRDELLKEYREITRNFSERRWKPSELSGGLFCEVVYSILEGHASGNYPQRSSKPRDMVASCRRLEANTHVPRSFQILIPRALPVLYEVRNNRGVGHVGGDVDSNAMDASLVLNMANWILAELVRVFHALSIEEAQGVVDALADRQIPLIWQKGSVKLILNPDLGIKEQILVLLASSAGTVNPVELHGWLDYGNKSYFMKSLRELHAARLVYLAKDELNVEILPPGTAQAAEIIDGAG